MEAQTLTRSPVAQVTPDWHRIFETLPDEHDYVVDELEGELPRELKGGPSIATARQGQRDLEVSLKATVFRR